MSSQRTYTEEEKMKYVAEFKARGMSMNEYAKNDTILNPQEVLEDLKNVDTLVSEQTRSVIVRSIK